MTRKLRLQRRVLPAADQWPQAINPVLRRIYAGRGVACDSETDLRLRNLLPPTLGGLTEAVDLLDRAIVEDWSILVVGDFDADGATGSALAVRGLRQLGARRVDYRVPNRVLHGYGLSPALVAELQPAPQLILTVDNGVAAHAGIAAAKARGIRVVVTDHHLPGDSLPPADAMVNPSLPGDGFPSKALAGVGVVFYLLLALRAALRERQRLPEASCDLSELVDLVALGTVADLVPLDANNRRLVHAGLRRIRSGCACAGIVALFEASGRDPRRACAADLGFAIGPRINAAGRLEDMALGIECLLADDAGAARTLAARLNTLNGERRDLQTAMVEQAEAAVVGVAGIDGGSDPAAVLFDADWHAGVVGLVASKLKERLHRPVIAFAPAGDGSDELKGSGRSIPGFHLRDALADVEACAPGLMTRFGGHAMAAGLSLPAAHLERFRLQFVALSALRMTDEMTQPVLYTDGPLTATEFQLELADQLRDGGPWGQGFPEPLFDNEFELARWSVMGRNHLRLDLRLLPERVPLQAVMFGGYDGAPPPALLRAAYQLEVNEWRGSSSLRLLLRHIEPLSEASATAIAT